MNETLRSARFEDCTGLVAGFDLPYEKVDQAVPVGFTPFGGDLPGTARVVIDAISCKRLVLPDRIWEGYRQFTVSPKVRTENASWTPTHSAAFYVLDRYVSHAEVEAAYRGWGLGAEQADIRIHNLPTSEAGWSWQVQRNATKYEFEYAYSGLQGSAGNLTIYDWSGPNPYLRVTKTVLYQNDQALEGGALRMEGPSRTHDLVGAPSVAWTGVPRIDDDTSMNVGTELFEGEIA